ncbi:MAG: nucleotide pyrophosphohydrolase [Lachnospiraceae bacterium]|nr:nucleotide pyrophosphohydrolase [Lachnospiraceae bacterium]
MTEFERFYEIIKKLRAEDGCPWDREQTHMSLKAPCIEEAAEVICGINILDKTGDAGNLREELGDLLLQVVMHAVIAEEEGLFDMDDVLRGISEKMIRRHPHVFGTGKADTPEEVLQNWDEIKKQEKKPGTEDFEELVAAFEESRQLIDRAELRKKEKLGK